MSFDSMAKYQLSILLVNLSAVVLNSLKVLMGHASVTPL